MNIRRTCIVGAIVTGLASACSTGTNAPPTPVGDAARGAPLFANNCAQCHGDFGQGINQGPPLIHEFYVPSHHSDAAFRLAAARGVQPHHWDFGAMPPLPAVSEQELEDIIAYVRQLQREAGLIE